HTGDAFDYDGFGHTAPHQDSGTLPVHWRDASGNPAFSSIEGITSPPEDALVWPLEFQKDAYYRRQGVTDGDGVIGDFSSLKQFRTDNVDLENALIRAYQYVIARFDCDGFRIDTLRYLQPPLPLIFGNSMREYALSIGKKNFFTFGEVFDNNAEEDIAKFIGRNTNADGDIVGVDAALDFPLFFQAKAVLKGFAAPQAMADMYALRKTVEQQVVSSHGEASRFFVTFLDNHDSKARFYYVDPANPDALDDQLTAAVACLFSLQGIPCVYYGTEQQLHGNDPNGQIDELCREALWGKPGTPFDESNPFYVAIQKIAQARASQPALRYGRQYFRQVSGDGTDFAISTTAPGVVAFSRILNDEEVLVVVNVADAAIDLHVIVDAVLQPVGTVFKVVCSNQNAPTAPDAVEDHSGAHAVRVHLKGREAQILATS
ncbi:MAG: hypothetical protein JO022_07140, partial [Acidobacteriaceae bacterium]|nr:hypothetical protein [Acidobacteriaceae bacterium]